MSVATLPSGVYLYYTDSGTPREAEYDTIVVVHGVAYNAGTSPSCQRGSNDAIELFSPLNSVLPPNIRIIAYNQRGYNGSTPLSKGELDLSDDRRKLTVDYSLDLVEFLEYITSKYSLPRKPILLGWSKGTNLLLALACPTFLPSDLRNRALKTVSALIMFEAPGNAFGLTPTEDYTSAMAGPYPEHVKTEEGKKAITAQRFSAWISGFYKHENLVESTPVYGVDPVGFSADSLDKELLAKASEPALVPLGFHWGLSADAKERAELAKQAIEQKDLPIAMAWNGETAGYIVSAVKAGEALGAKIYKLDDKGNHLFFAHEPKKFVDGICKVATDLTGHKVG
jgi:pimeloyl-ACP methyl ester carboxylesterase